MGDGIMAMFGAPMASEQHAVDACEAALEMQQTVSDYATDGDASALQIRVGLHSGEVVVLTVGEGDNIGYDASGPTVPIAARMEQVASPGEIYLTSATRALAEPRIDTDSLDPVLVKGISDPVPVFVLHRLKSPEEIASDTTRTPFVGRRAELVQFRGMVAACVEEGYGQAVYVRGEPGIGKTRLVEQFERIAAEGTILCHRGLVLPFGVGKGQDAVRSLVRSLIDLPPSARKEQRQNAADRALGEGRLDPDQAVFLNDLLDLEQPVELRALYDAMANATRNSGKQAVVSDLVATAANASPTVIIVEDVHWADGLTLTHLSTITKTVSNCPALLVMTSRIEGDQLDQIWRSSTDGSPFIAIDLGPLRKQDSIALIGEFLDANDSLAVRCLERAAGNPLFLEQLLRNAKEGIGDSLPDSIQSLVLARMDRLEAEDKKALQAASVMGQRFHPAALSHLLDVDGYNCGELLEHNLLRTQGEDYLFAHALIQESVYGSLLKRQRQDLHVKAAEWFAGRDLILHAQQLGYAGDNRAPRAYLNAAREQAQQYRFERALGLVNQGLEIDSELDAVELRSLAGELHRNLGSVSESISSYRQALGVAIDKDDRCRTLIGVAEGLRITGQHDEVLDVLGKAETIAEELSLSGELARIHQLRGGVSFMRAEFEACLRENTVSLEYARDANSPELEAQALSGLADAEFGRSRMISAYGYFDRCIELSRTHGFGRIVAANLSMRGKTHYYRNDFESMLADVRAAVELATKIRNQPAEMVALQGGTYLADMGNVTEGQAWLQKRLDIARLLGAPVFEANALAHLGSIAVQEGRPAEANELAQKATDILRESESGMRFWGPYALGTLALATDDPERCRLSLEEGEKLLHGNCPGPNYFWFYRDAMEVCLQTKAWDDVERYAMALEDYTSAEPLPWSNFYIARGRALAAFGRGKCDGATRQELQCLHDEAERVGLKVAIPALGEALSAL